MSDPDSCSDDIESQMSKIPFTRRDVVKTAAIGGVIGSAGVAPVSADDHVVRAGDLIAHWPFEDGFEDSVGGMNASPDQGDPTIGTYDDKPGVAMDGDDGLRVGNGSDNPEMSFLGENDGPVTISSWVYFDQEEGGSPNSNPTNHHILRKDSEYAIKANPLPDTDSTVGLVFNIAAYSSDGNSYSTSDNTTDELHVPIQEWVHFTFVVNPTNYIYGYINGEEVFSDENMNGWSARNTDYWSHQTIGSWYGTGSPDWYNLLVGKLSDFRIYDGRLSGEEINEITSDSIPGFGVPAAVVGLGGAGYLLKQRLPGGEPNNE